MWNELDAEEVAAHAEWVNFKNGPNLAQVAVAQRVPNDVTLDELDGIVFYCDWGANGWKYSMLATTNARGSNKGRFMTPNNGERKKISAGVSLQGLTHDLRIIGKHDVQRQIMSS